ncbi:hypothetical protein GCM10009808_01120 [Microbacterium sediminicola]|uniref:DUF5134 domain-containing protein n=1 Tax=Microbacterium sediminicola TaxID=415210 RepID=A0ABN2HH60_9MICO
MHVGATGTAAVGACCLVPEVRRSWRELLLTALMAVAMLDQLTGIIGIPVVFWAALTVGAVLALSARRSIRHEPGHVRAMHALLGVGAILMAALMVVGGASGHDAAVAHQHGASLVAIVLVLAVASVAHVTGSLVLATRHSSGLPRRVHEASMALSMLMMVASAVVMVWE